jgi:hypothetical protein
VDLHATAAEPHSDLFCDPGDVSGVIFSGRGLVVGRAHECDSSVEAMRGSAR